MRCSLAIFIRRSTGHIRHTVFRIDSKSRSVLDIKRRLRHLAPLRRLGNLHRKFISLVVVLQEHDKLDIRRTVNCRNAADEVFSVRCTAGISNIDRSPFRYRELRDESLERHRVSTVRQGETDDIRIDILFYIISLEVTCIVLGIEAERRKDTGMTSSSLLLSQAARSATLARAAKKARLLISL